MAILRMQICRYLPLLFVGVLGFGSLTKARSTETAQRCGVDQKEKPHRIFADPDGKNWTEYKSIDGLPELTPDVGASVALVWASVDGKTLFSIEDPEQDFSIYTDYCFNSKGELVQVRYELRTAWGWGYRTEGPIVKRILKSKVSEFFDTSTGVHTEKPFTADGLPWATKPKLCMRQSELPFFRIYRGAP